MTVRSMMTQFATIRRRQGTVRRDEYQNDTRPFTVLASGVACLAQPAFPIERISAKSMGVVDEVFSVWMPLETDIAEADIISEIRDRVGNLVCKNLDITGVRRVSGFGGIVSHLELIAVQYRSGVSLVMSADPTPSEEPRT